MPKEQSPEDWARRSAELIGALHKAGVTGRRLLLVLLAAGGYVAMTKGVPWYAVVAVIVTVYCLDAIKAALNAWAECAAAKMRHRTAKLLFDGDTKKLRSELQIEEPELPLTPKEGPSSVKRKEGDDA